MSILNLGTSFLFNTDFKMNEIVDTGATMAGRKVYAKYMTITAPTSSGVEQSTAHGISRDVYGYFYIIDIIAELSDNSPNFYPLSYYNGSTYCTWVANRTNVTIKTTNSGLLGRNFEALIIFMAG